MDKKDKTNKNTFLANIAEDTIRRYGSGIKEHLVAYTGMDHETGTQLKRSLEGIHKSKVNPEYENQNLKQQAGFSAELKEVVRRRAEERIRGKKAHAMRTDDIPGHVNDQLFDITEKVDKNGNPVPAASAQMKFVGSSPEAAVDRMLTKQYQRYHDNDVKIMVPKDYYPGMKEALQNKISSLNEQISTMREKGFSQEAINAKVKQLENCKTLQKNLRESKVTNAEAMEARTNPMLSTVKDITKLGHRAGIEQAEMGAAIGGTVSIVKNVVALSTQEKTAKNVLLDISKDTAEAAVESYITAAGATVISGAAQNASSATIRAVSKTNAPAYIAVSTLEVGKTMTSYVQGNIDTEQCLKELGEKDIRWLTVPCMQPSDKQLSPSRSWVQWQEVWLDVY